MNRLEFIVYWAKFVKKSSDREWSRQQKILIDSQIKAVREFYKRNPEIARKVIERFRKGTTS